ncbi:MAG: hypothetical protein MUD01_26165 [Chloroflexaceae bacterium]|nr:hypothetical protein [Chloroflexaceae bacterium]
MPASVSLRLDAPPTLVAGTAATVRLSGAVPDGTSATLLLLGSYGPHMVQASFSGGSASFALPAEATRHAGVTDLIASAGEAQARSQLDILPGAPVSPVVPMVGPRSTVADGRVELMAVVIPTDAWGNPAADGTDVTLRVRQPGNREQQWSMLVAGGLAWERIVSGTRSGRTTVAASSGAASGPEASVREIAGPPASFTLSADPTSLPADGHQTLTLRTGQVQDRYGNTLPDGTLVTFIVEAADGTVPPRRLPALLVGGVAETPLQAPATPGTMRARASIAGVLSPVVELHFTP